ncbi:hypothetical protein [Haliangium sp.]|uniref:hypothetical protein n=1 Tax=Haliangium sp. TaxID=2663208 RepID=UPI003D135987
MQRESSREIGRPDPGAPPVQRMRVTRQDNRTIDTDQISREELEYELELASVAKDYAAMLDLDLALKSGDYLGGDNPRPSLTGRELALKQQERRIRWGTMRPLTELEQSQSPVERLGIGSIVVSERARKSLLRLTREEEARHREFIQHHPEQMEAFYRVEQLSSTRLTLFHTLPLEVLNVFCSQGILAQTFACPATKLDMLPRLHASNCLGVLLDTNQFGQLLTGWSDENIGRLIGSDSCAAIIEGHMVSPLGQISQRALQALFSLPSGHRQYLLTCDIHLACSFLEEISRSYDIVASMPLPSVQRFLALDGSCWGYFFSLRREVIRQFLANDSERQQQLLSEGEIFAMAAISDRETAYAPKSGDKMHDPHSLTEHGAQISAPTMRGLARSADRGLKSRWTALRCRTLVRSGRSTTTRAIATSGVFRTPAPTRPARWTSATSSAGTRSPARSSTPAATTPRRPTSSASASTSIRPTSPTSTRRTQ